jgi:hypothetical protein
MRMLLQTPIRQAHVVESHDNLAVQKARVEKLAKAGYEPYSAIVLFASCVLEALSNSAEIEDRGEDSEPPRTAVAHPPIGRR